MKFSYSFSITPPAPPLKKPPEKLAEYSYNEFLLDLPEHWQQIATADGNMLNWQSDVVGAAITVSCDFYEIPDEKSLKLAEVCLKARHEAMEVRAPGQVTVLSRSIKPYSGGSGLEMSYSAQIPGSTYLYLGYVTSRKVFNFSLTYGPDKVAAADLYNLIMTERLRVKIP
ncbi:hypothetical protein [Collimonas humicola]|uniref:hypothetical protein n=1 Tax=Collimonas humicola TaxID=2825886 RepID=UPI001B8C2369|nr:hypothetical protein [Collimonas humicola]